MPGRRSKVTPELYAQVVAAWIQNPHVKQVAQQLGISQRLVERLRDEGVPELRLDPLPPVDGPTPLLRTEDPVGPVSLAARIATTQQEAVEYMDGLHRRLAELEREAERVGLDAGTAELKQRADGTLDQIDQAKRRVELDSRRLAVVEQRALAADATQKSADEVVAARMVLQHCLTAGAIFGHLANKMLELIESDKLVMPEALTPRMVGSLMGSIERLANATDKAIKIESERADKNEPAVQISPMHALLQQCSLEELEFVRQTGRLPQRLRFVSGNGD